MGNIKTFLFFIAALFFIGQVVASPLLSCCSPGQTGHAEGVHDLMSMSPIGSMAEGKVHDLGLDSAQELAHQMNDSSQFISEGCNHQCNYCVSISSFPVLEDIVLMSDYAFSLEKTPYGLSCPQSLSETFFRPPIFI